MTKTAKKYEVFGGVILKLDFGKSFRYHGPLKYNEPTITFYYCNGSISQRDVAKAAARVMSCSAVTTRRQVQLSTRMSCKGYKQAEQLADAFIDELNKLLSERDRKVAIHSASKSDARSAATNRRRPVS